MKLNFGGPLANKQLKLTVPPLQVKSLNVCFPRNLPSGLGRYLAQDQRIPLSRSTLLCYCASMAADGQKQPLHWYVTKQSATAIKRLTHMKMYLLAILLATLALVGCDQQAIFDKFIPQGEAEFSKNYLALFPAQDFNAIEAKIDPALKDVSLREKLKAIADSFPAGKPKDIKVVGVHTFTHNNSSQLNLSFQYEYPTKWLLANVTLEKTGDVIVVKGVNVEPLVDSLENINRFSFDGKGIAHYIILISAMAIPIFILISLVLCIRTPIPKRKWLWVIFVLCGFFQFSLNWTTGVLNINPLFFQLLGAGFFKPYPFGAVVISVSLPIGALIFLWRRKQWLLAPVSEG
ncbi:hypothetical protein [Vogesella sp. LIG4]|uniref:hypothetical protein n=1 Tax=Vogesella sp. LIG4 TaxID=1192162 RepID=UPI0012FD5E2D|nr:hypothetical protein [Vogesella sp. LIG4]